MGKILLAGMLFGLCVQVWAESSFNPILLNNALGVQQNLAQALGDEEVVDKQEKIQNKNVQVAKRAKFVRKCVRVKVGGYSCFLVWQ